MPETNPIRGQVARVLTTRELVINRGSADGVRVGMRFAVLDPQAQNIKDPETGKPLGSIFRPKVNVEVTTVEQRLSLASTYRKQTINVGGSGTSIGALAQMFEPPNYVDRYETFKSDDETWESVPEAQRFVKVGDPVVQLSAREDELHAGTGLAAALITRNPSSPPRRSRPPQQRAAKPRG